MSKATNVKLDDTITRMRRERMVEEQLRRRGIEDERVLEAMRALPRHEFVPEALQDQAYEDRALPIGFGQTISQPYMVALMLAQLRLTGDERVLDVGTGSGYQAALLAALASHVYSVEIIPELATSARNTLEQLGFDNVTVALANGSIGLPHAAPFDAIVVAAGAPEVPRALLDQLRDPGILVVPTGSRSGQALLRVEKHEGRVSSDSVAACAFVPLVGEHGWERTG